MTNPVTYDVRLEGDLPEPICGLIENARADHSEGQAAGLLRGAEQASR